jgi:hypothetical protein
MKSFREEDDAHVTDAVRSAEQLGQALAQTGVSTFTEAQVKEFSQVRDKITEMHIAYCSHRRDFVVMKVYLLNDWPCLAFLTLSTPTTFWSVLGSARH